MCHCFTQGRKLEEAREHRGEAVLLPGFVGLALLVEGGEGLGLLLVVPARPAVDGLVVLVGRAAGVADEALLGDVEFAAEAPGGGVAVVFLVVLGGRVEGLDVLAAVLGPLEVPDALPGGALFEAGGGVAVGGEDWDGSPRLLPDELPNRGATSQHVPTGGAG